MFTPSPTKRGCVPADGIEAFVHEAPATREPDPRNGSPGLAADPGAESRTTTCEAGIMTPCLLPHDGKMFLIGKRKPIKGNGAQHG